MWNEKGGRKDNGGGGGGVEGKQREGKEKDGDKVCENIGEGRG